jgi:hypothetical protein
MHYLHLRVVYSLKRKRDLCLQFTSTHLDQDSASRGLYKRDKSCDVVRGAHHVTRDKHAHPQYSIDCSSIEHPSEGTRNAP